MAGLFESGILSKVFNRNGGLDVYIQDQTTRPLDLFFTQLDGTPTTLLSDANFDDRTIELTSTTGFADGQFFGIFSTTSPGEGFYFGTQIGAPAGNTITIDTPIDFDFNAGDSVIPLTKDLNVNGSITPQIFSVTIGSGSQVKLDITRIILQITTTDTPLFNEFGNIPALTDGIVLRRKNGIKENIWNVKSNGEFANLAYDVTFYESGVGQEQGGLAVRYTFSGQDKHGVAVRLIPGDTLDLIVQDDLTALNSFNIIAQGHIVD